MKEVTVTTTIISVGDGGDIQYDNDPTHEDGEVVCYQCQRCGWEIPGITDSQELAKYLAGELDKSDEEYVKSYYSMAHTTKEDVNRVVVYAPIHDPETYDIIAEGVTEAQAWANARLYMEAQSDKDYVKSIYPNAHSEYSEYEDKSEEFDIIANDELLGAGETEEEAWESARQYAANKGE
jgi:hypothetical protein